MIFKIIAISLGNVYIHNVIVTNWYATQEDKGLG